MGTEVEITEAPPRGVHFSVLKVHCRWCGAEIQCELGPETEGADMVLAECSRQAAEKHSCEGPLAALKASATATRPT